MGAMRIRAKSCLLIFFLFFVSSVNAKFWDVNINSNFKNNISVGNNELGEVVLTRANTNPSTLYFNNDFSTIQIDLGDIVVNNASEILQIAGVTKNIGESYTLFTVPNNFSVLGLATNKTGWVSVRQLENPEINITFMSLAFNHTFPSTFILDNDKILKLNLTIPDNAPPSSHNPIMTIKLNNATKQNIQFPFTINKLPLWELKSFEMIKQINAGETGAAGNMTFTNKGNSVSTINVNITGNISNVLSSVPNTLVFPTVETKIQLIYNLGPAITTGNYTGIIFITGEGLESNRTVNIVVKDTILPEVTEAQIPEFMAGLPRTVRVKVKDNLGIKNVDLIKILNGIQEDESAFIKDQETDWWKQEVILLKPGDYLFKIRVTDLDGNAFYKNYTIPSILQDIVVYKNYYKFLTTKFDRWVVQDDFFSMNESIDLTVTVASMSYASGNFTMALELPNGELRYFDRTDVGFKPVVVNIPGKYNFRFKGDKVGDYNGVVRLSTNAPHVPFKDITVVGEIKDFYVPPPYNAPWYGGNLNCIVNDGGNPETSQTVCTIMYPGYVDVKDNAIPVTTEFKTKTETEYKDSVDKLNKIIFNKNFIIGVLIFLMVCLIIWFYFAVKIYPIFRFKLR